MIEPGRFSARIYRSVTLTAPTGGPERCYAEAFLWRVTLSARQPNGSFRDIRPEMPRVTMQIHSGGITGPLVGGAFYDLPPLQQDWVHTSFASFPRAAGRYTIDIAVTSGGVTVDDVTISCRAEIR